MELASLIARYDAPFNTKYQHRMLPGQQRAINAITRCRTADAGEVVWHCHPCAEQVRHYRSCGHRSCPQCQNHEATQWLQRQRAKLLPVDYFMVTFTLPAELRSVAWQNQKPIYRMLFDCAVSTLKDFGLRHRHLGGEIGLTGVLHTHSRKLDYHPHCHVIVPGGAIDRRRKQWKKLKGNYLFNEFALARVFRARFLAAMNAGGLPIPARLPAKWVADCQSVGRGAPALEYLSRYLYRGVISEANIISDHHGQVTFRYTEGGTGAIRTRTLPGEDFLWLVLQHVLPKGFRRVRDYGFLHGNAKPLLKLVQLVLHVLITAATPKPRPIVSCPSCRGAMQMVGVLPPLRTRPG